MRGTPGRCSFSAFHQRPPGPSPLTLSLSPSPQSRGFLSLDLPGPGDCLITPTLRGLRQ